MIYVALAAAFMIDVLVILAIIFTLDKLSLLEVFIRVWLMVGMVINIYALIMVFRMFER